MAELARVASNPSHRHQGASVRGARSIILLLLALAPAGGQAQIVLNEVLYDPFGADAGAEFVELIHPGDGVLGLTGLRLEFCNGAHPGDWDLLWEGGAADSVAANGLFLIAESATFAPDALAELGIQNGPDALRLRWGDEVLDLLGYGDGLDPSLYEGWPAGDPSGRGLSRRPDGVDTNQNALDWFAAAPTPGSLNFPAFRVKLLSATAPIPPVAPGRDLLLSVRVENGGLEEWPGALECRGLDGPPILVPPTGPGHVTELEFRLPAPPEGLLTGWLKVGPLGEAAADSLWISARIGLGAMMLSECLFAPDTGRPEWVELYAREPIAGATGFHLSDLSGTGASFTAPPLAAGERLLLCADPEALLALHPGLPAERVLGLSPWPSLANSGEAEEAPGWTDGLRLDDAVSRSDGMLYRGDWISARGVSLERLAVYAPLGLSAWSPGPAGSTPLAGPAPDIAAQASGTFEMTPNPFDPQREWLSFLLSEPGGALSLRLFDAAGRSVQTITGRLGGGTTRLVWDGRDRRGRVLPDGFYPFLLEWEAPAGGARSRKGYCVLRRRPS